MPPIVSQGGPNVRGRFPQFSRFPRSSRYRAPTEQRSPNANVLMSIFVLRTQRMMQGPHGRFQTSNPNKTLKGPAQQSIRTKHNESANARTKPSSKTRTTAPTKHTNKTKDRILEQNVRTKHPNKTFSKKKRIKRLNI